MKLCIADPPYLGRASEWYGEKTIHNSKTSKEVVRYRKADHHEKAEFYDDISTHKLMVDNLIDEYDGWAIAMAHDNLRAYLPLIPKNIPIRIGIWNRPPLPGGSRVINGYEPCIVRIPEGRKSGIGFEGLNPRDCVTIAREYLGFTGSKPKAWTRWVLDMLGYDPEVDTVDDLFHGSGAVAKELAQGVLL